MFYFKVEKLSFQNGNLSRAKWDQPLSNEFHNILSSYEDKVYSALLKKPKFKYVLSSLDDNTFIFDIDNIY